MLNKSLVVAIGVTLVALLLLVPGGVVAQERVQRVNTIQIQEDTDAVWTIEIREPLDNESEVSNYQSYVNEVSNQTNNQTTERFKTRFSSVINAADSQYERNMSLSSLTVEAEIVNTATGKFGVTRVEFTWTNYARKNEQGSIVVGEILSDGYTLSETEKLTIVPPNGYNIQNMSSGTAVSRGAVEWTGPYAFSNLEIFMQQGTTSKPPVDPVIGGAVVLVVLVLAVGAFAYTRRDTGPSEWSTDSLQTEEEQIVELLEENDGRIKQKMVADEFDWSDAKVSRVTSSLEEDGVIEKLMVGRENVLDLNEDRRED